MSFRSQVRRARAWGIGAILAGLILAVVTFILEDRAPWLANLLAVLTMALIAGGALLALVGGVMRPLQRLAFRHGLPAGRLRDLVQRQERLRWWYGLDENGQTRDD